MSRNEFFAGLCILACANGLGSRIIYSVDLNGWTNALLNTFEISAVIFAACAVGIWLIARGDNEEIRSLDFVFGTGVLVLIIFPVGAMSWLALAALSVYMFLVTSASSSRRRGAIILFATTIPMLWSRLLFQVFSNLILGIDAALVALLLRTERAGNMVRFVDGTEYLVILPACSSIANLSLAFLCWVVISQSVRHKWTPQDIVWCFFVSASVVATNVIRLSLMGLSGRHYQALHNPWGEMVTNTIMLAIVVGISLMSVKRELVARI